MLRLNVYKHDAETGRVSQTQVAKTVTAEAYDLMFGTVEDVLSLLDAVGDNADTMEVLRVVTLNWDRLCSLLLDIFPDLGHEDLPYIKVREVVPVIIELFRSVVDGFGGGATAKNMRGAAAETLKP